MADLDPYGIDCLETVDDFASLDRLKEPSAAGVLLKRPMPLDVRAWIDAVPADQLPGGRVILRPSAVPDAVRHLFDIVALPAAPERSWLQEDVARLAEAFSELMGAPFLRLRFDVVHDNACSRFHIDTIYARLICTYRGAGTQYGVSLGGKDPCRIFTVETGSPILLRGKLWPEQPRSGLRHRSPPIEGTGETRLVLVLDPIYDPEGEV